MARVLPLFAAAVVLLLLTTLVLIHEPVDAVPRRPRIMPATGVSSAAYVGAATAGRTWDFAFYASDPSSIADGGLTMVPWNVQPDAGSIDAHFSDAGMVTYSQSVSTISQYGLGSAHANGGITFNGGWWDKTTALFPAYSGDGWKALTRIIFRHESGASGTAGIVLYTGQSAVGSTIITMQSTTTFRIQCAGTAGGNYSAIVTPPQGISVGDHVLDIFWSDSESLGALQRLNSMWYLDGVEAGAAEHTSDQAGYAGGTGNLISIGANVTTGASPLLGRTVFFVGQASGANLRSWYQGYQTTYQDCVALGLCPDMGGGASRGTGRGLLPGYDAGLNNIVQPSGFLADGRTRTGWAIYVPSSYNPNTPTNLYIHFCGCSWTGASCRGSFVAGSAATADPQLETPDPGGINVYMDAQYTDPTDCTTAGGGNGWPKGDTAYSDWQLQYTDAVVAYMRQNFAIRATWCVGRSNGGSWCEWLGAIRPDLFSGGQSAIGYLPGTANGGSGMTATIATGRTPMYLSHNRDDPTVAVNYARLSIPFWLAQNLGIDGGPGNPRTGDGGFGWCISTDGGVANDGSLLGGCGCGATQEVYDSGPPGSICCTWPASLANTAALDGGTGRAVRYCEGTGGHVPPPGEGQNSYNFWMTHGEDAGG